ncbi:MAG: DUF5615 family PIN-like protein [Bryobacterales bacterium]|nr:DUF5615 family PIN-like protein [Bryobacterales bacterium]
MRIRYQADNDLNKAIVRAVVRREPKIDFRSAQAARLDRISDSEVLQLAARESRILVSHDFRTMPDHFRAFIEKQRSPGAFLIAQDLPIGRAIDTLLLVWEVTEAEEWENRLSLIPSLVTIVLGSS